MPCPPCPGACGGSSGVTGRGRCIGYKVVAPELTGRAIRAAAGVLGARFYLRCGIGAGIFQKLLRDQLVVGLFDGSTGVCLQALGAQLPLLLGARPRGPSAESVARFALGRELPAFDASRLVVGSRGEDSVLQSLGEIAIPAPLTEAHDAVIEKLVELRAELVALRARGPSASRSTLPFHLAEKYATLHAAAACLQLAASGTLVALPPGWAAAAVCRLLCPDIPLRERVPEDAFVDLRGALFGSVVAPRTLSLTPMPLFDSPIHDVLPKGIQ